MNTINKWYTSYYLYDSCIIFRFRINIYIFFLDDYFEYKEYECATPLLQYATLNATSALGERGPNNARLHGKYIFKYIVMDFEELTT